MSLWRLELLYVGIGQMEGVDVEIVCLEISTVFHAWADISLLQVQMMRQCYFSWPTKYSKPLGNQFGFALKVTTELNITESTFGLKVYSGDISVWAHTYSSMHRINKIMMGDGWEYGVGGVSRLLT